MNSLDIAFSSINKHINRADGSDLDNPARVTWDGTPYVTITSGGLKEEGDPYPAWFSTEEQATSRWFEEIMDYYDQNGGGKKIRWRNYPEIVRRIIPSGFDFSVGYLYCVRSRVAFE